MAWECLGCDKLKEVARESGVEAFLLWLQPSQPGPGEWMDGLMISVLHSIYLMLERFSFCVSFNFRHSMPEVVRVRLYGYMVSFEVN